MRKLCKCFFVRHLNSRQHSEIENNFKFFRFNITSTGAELAERLLTGTDEMFQPEGGSDGVAGNNSMFSPPGAGSSGRKKNTKPKNQPRERLPEPGEALLENLHSILNDLNGSKKSGYFSSFQCI